MALVKGNTVSGCRSDEYSVPSGKTLAIKNTVGLYSHDATFFLMDICDLCSALCTCRAKHSLPKCIILYRMCTQAAPSSPAGM